jgi:hypothetical protein
MQRSFFNISSMKFLDNEGKVQSTLQGIHKPTAWPESSLSDKE